MDQRSDLATAGGAARLIARTRALLKNVKSLALLDLSDRVARLSLGMAPEENGQRVITERLPKRDIANRVGATRDIASRAFKDRVLSGCKMSP